MVINSKLNAIRRPDAIDTPILQNSNYNFGNQIKNTRILGQNITTFAVNKITLTGLIAKFRRNIMFVNMFLQCSNTCKYIDIIF